MPCISSDSGHLLFFLLAVLVEVLKVKVAIKVTIKISASRLHDWTWKLWVTENIPPDRKE